MRRLEIPVLPSSAYLGFVTLPKYPGAIACTHAANIIFDARIKPQGEHAYIKIYPPGFTSLCSELVGYSLNWAKQIPQPRKAALLRINTSDLNLAKLGAHADWLRTREKWWAWCTAVMPGEPTLHTMRGLADTKEHERKLLRHADTRAIAAADAHYGNGDRNSGNLIEFFEADTLRYGAIDQGMALGTFNLSFFGPMASETELIKMARRVYNKNSRKEFLQAVQAHCLSNRRAWHEVRHRTQLRGLLMLILRDFLIEQNQLQLHQAKREARRMVNAIFYYLHEQSRSGWLTNHLGELFPLSEYES